MLQYIYTDEPPDALPVPAAGRPGGALVDVEVAAVRLGLGLPLMHFMPDSPRD